ncbi:MAG: YhjD/YihY/BrkB family envelope integrity protein [Lautropia sp.]|nr:YhjD/YihY/BrkB family envelope integrity protein [Lautropia sp.]
MPRTEQNLLSPVIDRLYHLTTRRQGVVAALARAAAVFVAIVRDIAFGNILLWATSLVYTTLLSIVPMLALTFSVSKSFGVHDQIEPTLKTFLEPLGPKGDEITVQIMGFINNMNAGVLGSVGLALLLFTTISTILKIEGSINAIWHVHTLRPLSQRVTAYISVLLLGPVLIFSSLAMTAAVMSSRIVQRIIDVEPFGLLAVEAGRLLPYVLVIALFFIIYRFMPNIRVRFLPALFSALVAGIAWQSAGWAFARFVSNSGQYDAIYSGLAILIIFMIWLYVSWVVLLCGASVGFYLQHPEYLQASPGNEPRLSPQHRDQLGFAVMQAIAERYRDGGAALQTADLADRFYTPAYAIDEILEALKEGGLLLRASTPPGWVPARDLGNITLWQVLEAIHRAGDIHPPEPPATNAIQTFLRAQERFAGILSGTTFRDLVDRAPLGKRHRESSNGTQDRTSPHGIDARPAAVASPAAAPGVTPWQPEHLAAPDPFIEPLPSGDDGAWNVPSPGNATAPATGGEKATARPETTPAGNDAPVAAPPAGDIDPFTPPADNQRPPAPPLAGTTPKTPGE